jgi:hypothetical protein
MRWLLLGALALTSAGCDLDPMSTAEHQVLLSDAKTRIELEKQVYPSFPDTTVTYTLCVARGGPCSIALTGSLQLNRFDAAAARLPSGRATWIANTTLCTETPSRPACIDLADVSSTMARLSCYDARDVACTGALGGLDARLREALVWVIENKALRQQLRVAATVALARGAELPSAAETLGDDFWVVGAIARARGDKEKVDATRTLLAKSQGERMIAVRSCVPELAADVARAHVGLLPAWESEMKQAEHECALLPVPRRARPPR